MTALRPVLVAIVALLLPTPAFGWNGESHQLIAFIAEERLTAKAKAGVKDLLGDAALSDAEIVSWADEIRRERRETAPWHYVNIPVEADGYDPTRDGNGGDNVLDAITKHAKVLSDKQAPREDRIEALKFVVHFVGDLHQPLHCADRNGDKGGNKRLVFFPGRSKAVSLHQVWDTLILPTRKKKQSVAEYATYLNGEITSKLAKAWSKGSPAEWANDSLRIAKEIAYADVPVDGDPPKLSDEYIARAGPVVDEQIAKAGIRLAAILNEALR
jgi:hypothetical protein